MKPPRPYAGLSGPSTWQTLLHWSATLTIALGMASVISSCTGGPKNPEPATEKTVKNTRWTERTCALLVIGKRLSDGSVPVRLLCDREEPVIEIKGEPEPE